MNKGVFERWLESMTKSADIALQYQFQKDMIKQNLLSDSEIDVIADRVIQRLHITADISEVIAAIDDLDDKIKNLGNN